MNGLPFTVQDSDVYDFFSGYQVVNRSVKLGRQRDGRSNGQAAILFNDEDVCKQAMTEKQGQNIGHRWVELYLMTQLDYTSFNSE